MQSVHNHMDFDNVDFCKLMLTDSLNRSRIQVFYILQMDLLHTREGNNTELCGTHQFDKVRWYHNECMHTGQHNLH